MQNTIQVVAALIFDKDKFLICQRPQNKTRGLLWEFVGGKVEKGESKQDALIRECREELAITICPQKEYAQVTHEYADITVCLTLFLATITSGTVTKIEHNDVRWITANQIDEFEFCPADVTILQKIKQDFGNF